MIYGYIVAAFALGFYFGFRAGARGFAQYLMKKYPNLGLYLIAQDSK